MNFQCKWLSAFRTARETFTENVVICCHQVTKLFCSKYCFASASSARSPCHLGSQAYFAISIFWEVSENTALPRCHFCGAVPNLSNEKCVLVQALLCQIDVLIFICVFGFCEGLQHVSPCSTACTSTSLVAGLDVKSSVTSCVNDVGDVLVVELEGPVDNPGLPFSKMCGFWPLYHS